MEKLIDIANRAVADYGFRQAVLYGAADIARRWALSEEEAALLSGPIMAELSALPIPVQPADIPAEQARIAVGHHEDVHPGHEVRRVSLQPLVLQQATVNLDEAVLITVPHHPLLNPAESRCTT